MNTHHPIRVAFAAGAAALTMPLFAYWTPIQINLAGDAGLPAAAESVYGIRANVIYGGCDKVVLFDAGLFNRTTQGVYGIRAGLCNWTMGESYGITAGVANVDEHNAGLTAGAFNYAKHGWGVQVGIVNVADEFSGIQIGLLNFHFNSAVFFLPIFNMGSK